jgi:hypothetical protein
MGAGRRGNGKGFLNAGSASSRRRACRAPSGRRGPAMPVLSLICLVSGAALAGLAPKDAVRQATLESAGGGLIVLGLVIIGAGLPLLH